MDVTWLRVSCPVYGRLGLELLSLSRNKPQPWADHLEYCLRVGRLSAGRMEVILGCLHARDIIASAWLSLPDNAILNGFNALAFLAHVQVDPNSRKRGLGSKLVEMACTFALAQGSSGVVLATANKSLRENFYYRLGFRPIPDDPWLMIYCPSTTEQGISPPLILSNSLIRVVSPYDLATVQSICAQKHWTHTRDSIRLVGSEECEEDFCKGFVEGIGIKQFLIRKHISRHDFVCWGRLEPSGWLLRIIDNELTKPKVHLASKEIIKSLSGMLDTQ